MQVFVELIHRKCQISLTERQLTPSNRLHSAVRNAIQTEGPSNFCSIVHPNDHEELPERPPCRMSCVSRARVEHIMGGHQVHGRDSFVRHCHRPLACGVRRFWELGVSFRLLGDSLERGMNVNVVERRQTPLNKMSPGQITR